MLASLNINPDEIEDERYATAFRILFAIIEKQNEEIEFLKAEIQKLRDEITYSKVNKPNLRFVALTKKKIFLQKNRDKKDGFRRARNLNQKWIK